MNTTPDEVMLALWLDDELQGDELAAVDAWAQTRPEQLAAREEVRKWRGVVQAAMPAAIEPPYPDFFNSRVEKGIRDLEPTHELKRELAAEKASSWKSWFFPAAAFAGMVFAFWMGTQASDPDQLAPSPTVYTPQKGVDAEWFASAPAEATVIVLEGVEAIPDTLDFSDTAYLSPRDDGSATAERPFGSGGELIQ